MTIKPLTATGLFTVFSTVLVTVLFIIPATSQRVYANTATQYQAIVNHPARNAADRANDPSRKPAELLAFMQIEPGMVAFEQGAGGGYTTELLALAVGEKGQVFAEGLAAVRLANDRLPQVKPLAPGLIYQIPARAQAAGLVNGEVDLVVMMFTYHDLTLNDRIDRAALLNNLKAMLKSGGKVVIADNAAINGSGLQYTDSLHRIDPLLIKYEFEQAGFQFDDQSDLYHNNRDDLKAHWRFVAKPRQHHRLLLRFKKP